MDSQQIILPRSGTLAELGWFPGRSWPIFGYLNIALPFAKRSRLQVGAVPDPLPGLAVEGFGPADNLMIHRPAIWI